MKAARSLIGLRAVDGAGRLVAGTLAIWGGWYIGSDGDEGRGGVGGERVCMNDSDLLLILEDTIQVQQFCYVKYHYLHTHRHFILI